MSIGKDGNTLCPRSVQEIRLPKDRTRARQALGNAGAGTEGPSRAGSMRRGAGPEGGQPVPGRPITALRAPGQKKILHVCL